MNGARRNSPDATAGRPSRTWGGAVRAAMWVVVIAGFVVLFLVARDRWPGEQAPPAANSNRRPASLGELLALPPQELVNVDVARMNLLCASGLPGAEQLDVAACLARLDQWADRVRAETLAHLGRFHSNPGDYNHSEGYFRMLALVTVLQQDFGVRYNPKRIRDVDFKQSKDLFLHGLLGDANGGTCVSLPVLYTAVARRLGYPVRLVLTYGHVFCRWNSPVERFNIEATNQGLQSFPDEYYKTWPARLTDAQVQANRYLVSLSPAEELACFLASRGHCLMDTGRPRGALAAYSFAAVLAPGTPAYASWSQQARSRLGLPPLAGRGADTDGPMVYRGERIYVEDLNEANRRRLEQSTRPPSPAGLPR